MDNAYRERFRQLVNYYNYDKGINLPDIPDERADSYRAVCANIAWCMVDTDRFWEYYNKSEYWKIQLMTSVRHFGVKPFLLGENTNPEIVAEVREYLITNYGKKFILTPQQLNGRLDFETVYNILHEGMSST